MSTIDRVILKSLRSREIVNDPSSEISQHFGGQTRPKIPDVSMLEDGEITLNIASDHEIIGIKNSDDNFVYLPFNLGDRMLSAETQIVNLIEEVESGVYTSGSTSELYHNLEELSAKTLSLSSETINSINELNTSLNSFSSSTLSSITSINNEIVSVSGDIITYVNVGDSELSSYTTSVSATLYSYITQESESINNRIENLTLPDLSDVNVIERESCYTKLDRALEHDDCYIQCLAGGILVTMRGDWEPDAEELVWEILNYEIVGEYDPSYIPSTSALTLTATTEASQLAQVQYIGANGQLITYSENIIDNICNTFEFHTTVYCYPSPTTENINQYKTPLNYGFGNRMKYAYIPYATEGMKVYFYSDISTNNAVECEKYPGYSNVWVFSGNVSDNSAIAVMSDYIGAGAYEVRILGDTGSTVITRSVITLCYDQAEGGIQTVLTYENPKSAFEMLARYNGEDQWTNMVIGFATKTNYGIVKIGDGIKTHDGIIEVDADLVPDSASTNPVANCVVYEAVMSMNTLTNEEMDILLGGPLPNYLTDENGEMVLDEEGNFVEVI